MDLSLLLALLAVIVAIPGAVIATVQINQLIKRLNQRKSQKAARESDRSKTPSQTTTPIHVEVPQGQFSPRNPQTLKSLVNLLEGINMEDIKKRLGAPTSEVFEATPSE